MPWLNHPSYVPLRDDLARRLHDRSYLFKMPGPVVFLCGGSTTPRKNHVQEFLRRHPKAMVFFADDVWVQIAGRADLNALQMEQRLAELADVVVIIVESPGTFAELGAFSLLRKLRLKLLPILDRRFRSQSSFINTGPVKWIDAESQFRPAIFADFDVILSSAPELEERLRRLQPRTPQLVRSIDLAKSPKDLLFFIIDLVTIIGPAPSSHVAFYVEKVAGSVPGSDITHLLSLAVALEQISTKPVVEVGQVYFRPPAQKGPLVTLGTGAISPMADRARILNVLQHIDAGLRALSVYKSRE